jgi:hypothetical protein
MNEHGMKTRNGMLFSRCLRDIGREQTELAGDDPETGDTKLISKIEALARKMWELALGWEEEIYVKVKGSEEKELKIKKHKPDVPVLKELLERLEGKAGADTKKDPHKPVNERIREQSKDRINALTDE